MNVLWGFPLLLHIRVLRAELCADAAGSPSGVEGRDDRAARLLAAALSQLQALKELTLAPAPTNLNLWQRLDVLPALTALELVFFGPNAHSGSAGNAKDSPVHAVDVLQYIRRLSSLQHLSLSCRRLSSATEQVLYLLSVCLRCSGTATAPLAGYFHISMQRTFGCTNEIVFHASTFLLLLFFVFRPFTLSYLQSMCADTKRIMNTMQRWVHRT